MKKELLIISLLLIASFPAVRSLLLPGEFVTHDLTHHIVRQISMDRLLSEGQFAPRWSGELNNGYGYPAFLFNYPLPAFVGEVFHGLGLNFADSVKAVLFLSMILSPLSMYLFLRSYLGSNLAAFLGGVFYLYAPHRLLNIYVSGAVGSALGDAILPLVFWSMVEVGKGSRQKGTGNRWVLVGALVFALLVLAHNITTLIFAPLILGFGVLLIWESKSRFKILRDLGAMFLLGLSLSAWFWLPVLVEKQYIIFDQIFNQFYQRQFISLGQFVKSPWEFGLSNPQNPNAGDLSYQIGVAHFLVMVFLIFAMVIFRKIRKIGLFVLFFFILSLVLMHRISQPLWDFVPMIELVQFPLRFSALSVFTASIGVALLIKYLPSKKIVFACFFVLVIYASRYHWQVSKTFDPGENYYLSLKTTTATFNEHLPKWGRVMKKAPPAKLEFIDGGGEIKVIQDQSAKVLADIEATGAAKLRFNQFYFPGWEIKVDNNPIKFDYHIDGESYGLPVFDIERGKHQVLAEFKNTADRNMADTMSIIGMILWLVLLCRLLIPNKLKAKK